MATTANPQSLNIARPYALAAFEYARDKEELPAWKAFLESAANIARDPAVARLLKDPEMPTEKLFDLFKEVLTSLLNDERRNFLLLLAQNKRLMLLSAISEAFNDFYAALLKISNVLLITAVSVDDAFKQKLATSLKRRIHHEVTLNAKIDPAILGGAIIQMGDKVIDGSIRGKKIRPKRKNQHFF